MKIILRHLALIVCMVCANIAVLSAQGTTITLLHVNDTHSHLDAVGPKDVHLEGTLGGIAKAATVLSTLRASEPNVLLLHAGDVFQGDPMFNTYYGVPEFQLMAQLGFDAMAVGNHEFDFGPGVLNDVLTVAFQGGSFPLVSANLDMTAFPQLQSWIQPSIIKTIAGVKIGIFGMTVPNNPTNMPAPVIVRDDIVPVAQEAVNALRQQGVNVVICLSHLGVFYDKIVAANVTGIDFIVGGHDHYLFNQPLVVNNPNGAPVRIFQAGEHYKYIGKFHFTVNNGAVTFDDYTIVNVDASVQQEPTVQAVVEQLKEGVSQRFGDLYHTILGTTTHELTKRYDERTPRRDTPIGNLVTDAFREKTGTDIAITALGLISEKIYEGTIVGADVFRSMSYGFDEATGLGFQLATFDINGAELVKGLEVGLSQLEVGDDFFLQVSGMRFKYDAAQPVGQRVILKSIQLKGKQFSPAEKYSVTVNTGIVALLGLVGVNVENLQILPDFEFTIVSNYIAKQDTVNYHSQGRILDMTRNTTSKNGQGPGTAVHMAQITDRSSCYPNPFNPATTIRYELPVASKVVVKVYNLVGQEVRTLVDQEQSAGVKSVVFDAGELPSGVYMYRIVTNTFTETQRLLLIK